MYAYFKLVLQPLYDSDLCSTMSYARNPKMPGEPTMDTNINELKNLKPSIKKMTTISE